MDLAAQYQRQYEWRQWRIAYDGLPALAGASVLDLGCGVGDQSRDLALRGASVTGVDSNPELIAIAAARAVDGTRFEVGDIRVLRDRGHFDGLWASFIAAYFPDLPHILAHWGDLLAPGGWIALVEVSGLFDHEPLPRWMREIFEAYVAEAFREKRYDFNMGSKLADHLRAAGFEIRDHRVMPDRELSFAGPADEPLLHAWGQRLDRIRLLRERLGDRYATLRSGFLACLADAGHRSNSQVHFCLGVKR